MQFEQMFGVFMMTSTLLWTRREREAFLGFAVGVGVAAAGSPITESLEGTSDAVGCLCPIGACG